MPKKTPPTIALRRCWRTLTRRGPSRAFSEAALVSSRSWAFNLSVYWVNAHLLLKKKNISDGCQVCFLLQLTTVKQLTGEGKERDILVLT